MTAIATENTVVDEVVELDLDDVLIDINQVRDEGADDEIADVLNVETLLPPIWVYPLGEYSGSGPRYKILDGERRYRASAKAERATIRSLVVEPPANDGDRLLQQLALNAGKKLKPMEEARSWKRILDAKGWKVQELADHLHKPKSTVSDRLAILSAPAVFQPLFAKGVLSAAAAPIVRQYAGLPEAALKKFVAEQSKDEWKDFVDTETPVGLSDVKRAFDQLPWTVGYREIQEKALAKSYTGETVTINGRTYATDKAEYEKQSTAYYSKSYGPSSASEKKYQRAREASRKKQLQADRRKAAMRRAQFAAISAKLPGSLDAKWALFAIDCLMEEIWADTLRVLAAELKLTASKDRRGGVREGYGKMIRAHAEGLDGAGRIRLVLRLLVARELSGHSFGYKRFGGAAKLLKINLAKVKPVERDEEE